MKAICTYLHSVSVYKKRCHFSLLGCFFYFPFFNQSGFIALQGLFLNFSRFSPWSLQISIYVKYQFWKNVTSEEWNSGTLNTLGHFLFSFLGVIAEYSSSHTQKWRQTVSKSVQRTRVSLFRSLFLSKLVL